VAQFDDFEMSFFFGIVVYPVAVLIN